MNFRTVPALPSQYSKDVKELIKSMMTVDSSRRPSISDLLDHPALKKRISKFMNDEEFKEEFDHTVLHNQNILGLKKTPSNQSSNSRPSSRGYARPYSARSNQSNNSRLEEAKYRPGSAAKKVDDSMSKRAPKAYERVRDRQLGNKYPPSSRAANKPPTDKFAVKGASDKLALKKQASNDQNKPPAQTPKSRLGARKNSEGLLHAHKLMPGFGVKNSPRKQNNFHYKNGFGKPSAAQTPRGNGAVKKLAGAVDPIGYRKQRPSSAMYGMYQPSPRYNRAKPLGANNGRIF